MNTTTVTEIQTAQIATRQAEDKAAPHDAERHAAEQAQAALAKAQAGAQAGRLSRPEEDVASAPAAATAELRFIALARLRLSKRDVRKTAAPVDALAESIYRVGLLQNLIVVPMAGGSLICKVEKALSELHRVGLLDDPTCRIFGAQASGCAPVT